MNVFTTDHPMVSQPPLFPRLRRWLLVAIVIYPLWLGCIGPLRALVGQGVFDFVPKPIRETYVLPAAPIYLIPGLRSSYEKYLRWWYSDPSEPDLETGWW